jgi:hypothetical protein
MGWALVEVMRVLNTLWVMATLLKGPTKKKMKMKVLHAFTLFCTSQLRTVTT